MDNLIVTNEEFYELRKTVESVTGFVCYEGNAGQQYCFYGISENVEAFKTMVAGKIPTATILYLLDTGDSYMYYLPTNTWY